MRRNDKRGFTLVEVIISVASLALISVFVLQMFIVSAQLSRDAADTDRAVIMAGALMETFRAQDAADTLVNDAVLDMAQTDIANGVLRFTLYYDADWQPVNGEGAAVYRISGIVVREDSGAPAVGLSLADEEGTLKGVLATLDVKAERFAKQGMNALALAEMSTSRFFDRGAF